VGVLVQANKIDARRLQRAGPRREGQGTRFLWIEKAWASPHVVSKNPFALINFFCWTPSKASAIMEASSHLLCSRSREPAVCLPALSLHRKSPDLVVDRQN
jgi:hypothetical protein